MRYSFPSLVFTATHLLCASASRPVHAPRFPSTGPAVTGGACRATTTAYQSWTVTPGGALASGSGKCLTSTAWPVVDGTPLTLSACETGPVPPTQAFTLTPGSGNAISLVSTAAPKFCANLAAYGTSPGTAVWLFTCTPTDCVGNCAWQRNASLPAALVNPGSGLCLEDAGAAPVAPHTCDAGSPAVGLPFCDASLPVSARVDDLYARLSTQQRIELFSIPAEPNTYDPVLNIPSVYWDIT